MIIHQTPGVVRNIIANWSEKTGQTQLTQFGSLPIVVDEVDFERVSARTQLRARLERPVSHQNDFESFNHFRALANDILLSSAVKDAYDLEKEDPQIRESYGNHLGGQSMLLARRLTDAGVPVVQVCCAAGDLNGGNGDMWDTHGDNFNRLKNRPKRTPLGADRRDSWLSAASRARPNATYFEPYALAPGDIALRLGHTAAEPRNGGKK